MCVYTNIFLFTAYHVQRSKSISYNNNTAVLNFWFSIIRIQRILRAFHTHLAASGKIVRKNIKSYHILCVQGKYSEPMDLIVRPSKGLISTPRDNVQVNTRLPQGSKMFLTSTHTHTHTRAVFRCCYIYYCDHRSWMNRRAKTDTHAHTHVYNTVCRTPAGTPVNSAIQFLPSHARTIYANIICTRACVRKTLI